MIERYLKSRRKHFEYDEDEDIAEMIPFFHEKNIEVIVINSPSARNEIVRSNGQNWTIIWDTFFWRSFEKFAMLTMSICTCKHSKEDYELQLDYLEAVLYEFLSLKYKHSQPRVSLCFAKQSLNNKYNYIDFERSKTKPLDILVKTAKLNLLSHELAHVTFDRHQQLENEITSIVKEYLTYLSQIEGIYEEYSRYPEMKNVLDAIPDFVRGQDNNLLSELVDDVYSFIEGLEFVTQQFDNKELATVYIYGALLLRDFNGFANSANGVVETCLKYQRKNVDIYNPVIQKTNYVGFFRYTLYSPLILFSLTQLYKENGIIYEDFKRITEPITEFQELYNGYVVPRLDYILRYALHHLVYNILGKKNLDNCVCIDKIVEFLFEDTRF